MGLKNIELVDALPQEFYDSFNNFIISSDLKIFGKLLARTELFQEVKNVPGDIVECGVFKGSGLLTFLKLKRYLCPNTNKKVVGFDFFNTSSLLNSLDGIDKDSMNTLFTERDFEHSDHFVNELKTQILSYGFDDYEFELVAGNVSDTSRQYVENNPGFRISLLYLDLDVEKPTYDTLSAMWDRVSSGGIVVFDEYAYNQWSEATGVDKFFADKYVKIDSLNYLSPTACIRKI